MNLEAGLQSITPDNTLNLPKKSASELEGAHFKEYVMNILYGQGEIALAEMVSDNKIPMVNLEALKAIESGNQAEKFAEKAGNDFNPADHINKRAQTVAEQLIVNKAEYLN